MIVETDRVSPQPWANGGGLTRELLREGGGHDWTLRLSVADIDRDGPFSALPGVVRWFAVLEGAGVALAFADGERVLRAGDPPLRFDGADAPGCRLLAGPTRDLNLMLRGIAGALVDARPGEPFPGAPAWPRRGFFEAAARRLHWPFAGAAAPAHGFWIGVER